MPIEFGAAAYRFGHSMVRPSYRANFTSGTGDSAARPRIRSSRWSSTPPTQLQRPGQLRPRRPARRLPGAPPLRRLADVLRPRRRAGQEQQEDRHHDLQRAVHPAAPRHRAAHPDRPGRAPPTQPAPPTHLGPALGPGDRRRMGVAPLSATDLSDIAASTAVRHQHAAVVLHPRRSQGRRPAASTSVRSAGASSPRPSSVCSEPTRPATSASPPVPAVPRHRPHPRAHAQPQHHRQPHLHPSPLPPLRRRRDPGTYR